MEKVAPRNAPPPDDVTRAQALGVVHEAMSPPKGGQEGCD